MNKTEMNLRLSEPFGEQIKSAAQKNLPFALDELHKSFMESNDDEVSVPIVIKARLLWVNENAVSAVIESVTVTRQVKHVDQDFESIDVDLNQPDLPGMNQ
jgi:hypothetical protein